MQMCTYMFVHIMQLSVEFDVLRLVLANFFNNKLSATEHTLEHAARDNMMLKALH